MNGKHQAVSCPLGRRLWLRFSYAKSDLSIPIFQIYTEVTVSLYGISNYLTGTAYHNAFHRIYSGSYNLFVNHHFRE